MFRLFQHPSQSDTASPSLFAITKNAINHSLAEITSSALASPSFDQFVSATTFWLQTGSVAASTCWLHQNVPYSFNCVDFLGDWKNLPASLLNLMNTTCGDFNPVNESNCTLYRSNTVGFGSNGYHVRPICQLSYPATQTPDKCTIDVLRNNTPRGVFVKDDIFTTGILASGGLILFGFMGYLGAATIQKCRAKQSEQALESMITEETRLQIV